MGLLSKIFPSGFILFCRLVLSLGLYCSKIGISDNPFFVFNMRVAIVVLGNLWVSPYVNIYKGILDELGVDYDVILWDRDGSDSGTDYAFSSNRVDLKSPITKLRYYFKYADYIKKMVRQKGYERLIVSGPHLGILLSSLLTKEYKGRYIMDYRDLAVEQYPILWQCFDKVLANSFSNVISSPGFRNYLPKRHTYLVSHNFNINSVDASAVSSYNSASPVNILTIGYIRNYDSNVRVLDALANNNNYRLSFVGVGSAVDGLKQFAEAHDIKNVSFSGFYKKEQERAIVEGCSFINILFPTDAEHSTIMSNRFYLALLHKRPVIVTSGSTQAGFVQKYNLGVVVSNDCANLDALIVSYLSNFDYEAFCDRCNALLALFMEDYKMLRESVSAFVG